MHRIDDAIVQGGKLVLSGLPFPEGQHVRVIVEETKGSDRPRLPIAEVRRLLRGGVKRYDDPFAPAIPPEDWEMLR